MSDDNTNDRLAPNEEQLPPSEEELQEEEHKGDDASNGRPSGKYFFFEPLERLKGLAEKDTEVFSCFARYGRMSNSGIFFSINNSFAADEHIIVKTKMGVEMGIAVTSPVPLPKSDIVEGMPEIHGEVLRNAVREDLNRMRYIEDELEIQEFDKCREMITAHNLPMKLVDVEHLFGGDRIVFYFLADGRVDFRALVKDLSKEFKTRIEMRQIGVRDEARLLADYEHCGRPLCCKSFMHELQPVTMKMAKHQKTTLDPAKISGRCGRLMCCLRFEDEAYNYLRDKLPKRGQIVATREVKGEVVNVNLLRELVLIRDENDNNIWVKSSEIVKTFGRPKENGEDKE